MGCYKVQRMAAAAGLTVDQFIMQAIARAGSSRKAAVATGLSFTTIWRYARDYPRWTPHNYLSDEQRAAILAALRSGMRNKDVAQQFGITPQKASYFAVKLRRAAAIMAGRRKEA